jgi:hypothetical protein
MTWRFKLQPRLLSRVFFDRVAGGLRHRRGESIARRGRPAEIGPAGRQSVPRVSQESPFSQARDLLGNDRRRFMAEKRQPVAVRREPAAKTSLRCRHPDGKPGKMKLSLKILCCLIALAGWFSISSAPADEGICVACDKKRPPFADTAPNASHWSPPCWTPTSTRQAN